MAKVLPRKVTTISLLGVVLKRGKSRAKKKGMTFSAYVGELISKDLKTRAA